MFFPVLKNAHIKLYEGKDRMDAKNKNFTVFASKSNFDSYIKKDF